MMLDGKCDCIARKHVLYNGKQSRFQVGKKFIPLIVVVLNSSSINSSSSSSINSSSHSELLEG